MKTNNELIAEFMCRDWKSETKWIENEDYPNQRDIEIPIHVTDLAYHTSWDWLMPVIEKCKKAQVGKWSDRSRVLYVDIEIALCNIDIDETLLCVIEFIKWYNQRK